MKYIRRFIFYILISVTHFLLQIAMMLSTFLTSMIFFDAELISWGGIAKNLSQALYQILSFPFVWASDRWSIKFPWFQDLPFVLNSLLWGWLIYSIIIWRVKRKRRKTRYNFVKGA